MLEKHFLNFIESFLQLTQKEKETVYDLGRSFFSLYKARSETLATLTT
jgi:hypothetical protein